MCLQYEISLSSPEHFLCLLFWVLEPPGHEVSLWGMALITGFHASSLFLNTRWISLGAEWSFIHVRLGIVFKTQCKLSKSLNHSYKMVLLYLLNPVPHDQQMIFWDSAGNLYKFSPCRKCKKETCYPRVSAQRWAPSGSQLTPLTCVYLNTGYLIYIYFLLIKITLKSKSPTHREMVLLTLCSPMCGDPVKCSFSESSDFWIFTFLKECN